MKHTLKLLVTEAVIVDRQLHLLARRLRALKTQIIHTAAHCHPHRPTEGGGRSWIAEGFDGSIARVSFPAHTLLSIVDPETDQGRHLIAKLGPRKLEFLHPVIHYQPVLDFRDRVRAAFENTQSREIIAACQTPTPPRVSFATKQSAHGPRLSSEAQRLRSQRECGTDPTPLTPPRSTIGQSNAANASPLLPARRSLGEGGRVDVLHKSITNQT